MYYVFNSAAGQSKYDDEEWKSNYFIFRMDLKKKKSKSTKHTRKVCVCRAHV